LDEENFDAALVAARLATLAIIPVGVTNTRTQLAFFIVDARVVEWILALFVTQQQILFVVI